MPILLRQIATILATALAAGALSGCGSINEKLAAGLGDLIPHWAGGLPADAPPRPGTAKYDEFVRERERKRLESAAGEDGAAYSSGTLGWVSAAGSRAARENTVTPIVTNNA